MTPQKGNIQERIEKLKKLLLSTFIPAAGFTFCGHYFMNIYRYPLIFGVDASMFENHPIELFSNIGIAFALIGIGGLIFCGILAIIYLVLTLVRKAK